MKDYIKWIRRKVGNDLIILNFAVACITNINGEILLQKRSREKELWGFPGGAMEPGESIEDTIIREVKEETGLDIKVDYLIGVYSKYFARYDNGDVSQTVCTFLKCSVTGGELTVDDMETFDLKYFKPEYAPDLFNEQNNEMLKDFMCKKVGVYK
jgi:8-oxo-dGTP pyrophosphatase MutT (NUDIX family)